MKKTNTKRKMTPNTKPLKRGLILRRNYHLTKGQVGLYELVCKKLKTQEPITFNEAKDIFINKVARDVRNGIMYREDYHFIKIETDGKIERKIKWFSRPMTDWEIKNRVSLWLVNGIGSLVLKGALKVIPAIEL